MRLTGIMTWEMGQTGFGGHPGGNKCKMGIEDDVGVANQNSASLPFPPLPHAFLRFSASMTLPLTVSCGEDLSSHIHLYSLTNSNINSQAAEVGEGKTIFP